MPAYGSIPGVSVGATFLNREALAAAGVHRPLQAGICGSASSGGAESIVLSGGYEDDEDHGDLIIYTGQGGNDPNTGRQVANQELVRGNLALHVSMQSGNPVRVTRGSGHRSAFSPTTGYRYAGLYQVRDAWHDRGRSGFRIWRFRLERATAIEGQLGESDDGGNVALPNGELTPRRAVGMVSRIIRDTAVTNAVKRLYGHACQVCGVVTPTASGPYAEGAHIRPLGRPHLGPDVLGNVLCLCPNHHVMFDRGGFSIEPATLELVGLNGALTLHPRHELDREMLKYHNERYRPLA